MVATKGVLILLGLCLAGVAHARLVPIHGVYKPARHEQRRQLRAIGSACASRGPDYFYECCVSKAASGQHDSSCITNDHCDDFSGASFTQCCVDKAAVGQSDAACPVLPPGSACISTGPDNFYSCCVRKAASNTPDSSCITNKYCDDFSGASFTQCCEDKSDVGEYDAACPSQPIGISCSSRGPDALYDCCEASAAKGQHDPSCPSSQWCSNFIGDSFVACCHDKVTNGQYDASCFQ